MVAPVPEPLPPVQPDRIWIVLLQDRQAGVNVFPYTRQKRAEDIARQIAQTAARHPELIEEMPPTDSMKQSGWTLYIRYGVEGDSVRVIERKLDEEIL